MWDGQGRHGEGGKQHGEVPLAVGEVVFEVVAVGFEVVGAFVLDLPACLGTGHDLGDGLGCHGQRGHEGAVVGDLAAGVGDADRVDPHGTAAVAQRCGLSAMLQRTAPRRSSGNAEQAERTPAKNVSRSFIQDMGHTMQHRQTYNREQPLRVVEPGVPWVAPAPIMRHDGRCCLQPCQPCGGYPACGRRPCRDDTAGTGQWMRRL